MAIVTVTSVSELKSALQTAANLSRVDRILCSTGTYGTGLTILLNGGDPWADDIPAGTTVEAEDPVNPPVFTQPWNLNGVKNIEFKYLRWEFPEVSGRTVSHHLVGVYFCSDIAFRNCYMLGANCVGTDAGQNGYGCGTAFRFQECSRISVVGCWIENTGYGISDNHCNDVLIEGNTFGGLSVDTLAPVAPHRWNLINNLFSDNRFNFAETNFHPDKMQVQISPGSYRHTKDMVIHGNRFLSFAGNKNAGMLHTVYPYTLANPDANVVISSWASYTTITAGTTVAYCPAVPAGTDPYEKCYAYTCKVTHSKADADKQPEVGANWRTYWDGPFDWEVCTTENMTITDNLVYGASVYGFSSAANRRGKVLIANNTLLFNPQLDGASIAGGDPPSIIFWDSRQPEKVSSVSKGTNATINLEVRNNICYGDAFTKINYTPAGANWVFENNLRIYAQDGYPTTDTVYFPGVRTATSLADLQAVGTVRDNRQGSFWTLPKKAGFAGF